MGAKQVVIIGGGVAGMAAASLLKGFGFEVTVVEREPAVGGHVAQWGRVFPNLRPAEEIVSGLEAELDGVHLLTNSRVKRVSRENSRFGVDLDDRMLHADAILVATGYKPFDATLKEELGYGVYRDVVTSVELEKMLKHVALEVPSTGNVPEVVAINHCVGSRDIKVGNIYCSRVCCTYGITHAVEIKERHPATLVVCFYIDIRAYGRGFEELYRRAQEEFGVQFIRGRIADVHEAQGRLLIRAEDTLAGLPLRMHVDLLSLSVGMVPEDGTLELAGMLGLQLGADAFLAPADDHWKPNESSIPGVFLAGTATGPKAIVDSITDGKSAAAAIAKFLR